MKSLINSLVTLSILFVSLPQMSSAEEFSRGTTIPDVVTNDGRQSVTVLSVDSKTGKAQVYWMRDETRVLGTMDPSSRIAIANDLIEEMPSRLAARAAQEKYRDYKVKDLLKNVKLPDGKTYAVLVDSISEDKVVVVGYYQNRERFEAILSKDGGSAQPLKEPTSVKGNLAGAGTYETYIDEIRNPGRLNRIWNSGPVRPVRSLSRMSSSFFLAQGIMAGLAATLDHSNNPMALAQFQGSWDDPVLYLVLAGYGSVAGLSSWALRKPLQGSWKTFLPSFAGVLFAATVASDVTRVVFNQPEMRQCYGLFSVKAMATLNWQRDASKCDEAWYNFRSNWMNGQYLKDLAPSISSMLVSTGIYFGLSYAVRQFIKPQLFNTVLKDIGSKLKINPSAFLKGPTSRALGRSVYGMAVLVGSYVVFQTVGKATNLIPFQKWLNDRLATTVSLAFTADPLGSTLQQNFSLVQDYYRAASDRQFRGFETFKLSMLIERMQEQTHGWRNLQLGGSDSAIKQWAAKVARFQNTYDQSYALYKNAVKQIADEREALANNQTLETPRLFNWDNILTTIRSNSNAYADPFEAPNTWELVKPKSLGEYLVVSAACGPNPDLKIVYHGSEATFEDTSSIRDHKYSEIEFLPPRLVQQEGDQTICDYQFKNQAIHRAFEIFDITESFHDGKTFRYGNLVDYIKTHIRPEIITASNHNSFEQWWYQNVYLAQVAPAYRVFEAEYKHIVEQSLKPALYNTEYRCFNNPSPSTGGSEFEKWFEQKDKCPGQKFSLGYGAIESVMQETNFYIGLLNDAGSFIAKLVPKGSIVEEYTAQQTLWDSHTQKLFDNFEQVKKVLGSTHRQPEYINPMNLKNLNDEITNNEKEFIKFLDDQLQTGKSPEKVNALRQTAEALLLRINTDTGGDLIKQFPHEAEQTLLREVARFTPLVQALHAPDGTNESLLPQGQARVDLTLLEDDLIKDAYAYVLFKTTIRNSYRNLSELINYRMRINMLDPRNLDRREFQFDSEDETVEATVPSTIEQILSQPSHENSYSSPVTQENKLCLDKSVRDITHSAADAGVRFAFSSDTFGRIKQMTLASRRIDRVYRIDFSEREAKIRMAKSVFTGPSTFEKVFGWFVSPHEDNAPVWLTYDQFNRWTRKQQFTKDDPAIFIQSIVDSKKQIEANCPEMRSTTHIEFKKFKDLKPDWTLKPIGQAQGRKSRVESYTQCLDLQFRALTKTQDYKELKFNFDLSAMGAIQGLLLEETNHHKKYRIDLSSQEKTARYQPEADADDFYFWLLDQVSVHKREMERRCPNLFRDSMDRSLAN